MMHFGAVLACALISSVSAEPLTTTEDLTTSPSIPLWILNALGLGALGSSTTGSIDLSGGVVAVHNGVDIAKNTKAGYVGNMKGQAGNSLEDGESSDSTTAGKALLGSDINMRAHIPTIEDDTETGFATGVGKVLAVVKGYASQMLDTAINTFSDIASFL